MNVTEHTRWLARFRFYVAFALSLIAVSATAADLPVLEYGYYAAEFADMSTTLDIHNHYMMQADGKMHQDIERNPLLGQHPSSERIIGTCIVTGAIHTAITMAMVNNGASPLLVNVWEALSIGVEGAWAEHNYSVGMRFKL